MEKARRNDPCPCGSGKKYKKCCLPRERLPEAHEQSVYLLQEGRLQEAEELLTRSLQEDDNTVARNNLATAVLQQDDPRRCLQILAPCLDPDRMDLMANPYTWSLASQALTRLGQRESAYQYLDRAENTFEDGVEVLARGRADEEELRAWQEYTVSIMRAAADLEDHQRVLDIYRRWKRHHVHWENPHMAAVACFNLGQYRKAASLWAEAAREWPAGYLCQHVSILVDQGVIPPFPLAYSKKSMKDFEALDQETRDKAPWARRVLEDTALRMLLLGMIFTSDPSAPDAASAGQMLGTMVHQGGTWGEELGQRLLQANCEPQLKMAATFALVEKGVLNPDQPVSMLFEGEEQEVEVRRASVVDEPDEKTLQAMERADHLKAEGCLQEAVELLGETLSHGEFFPPLALKLFYLLRLQDRLDEADSYLRVLENMLPHHPVIQFNRAGLLFDQGYSEEAYEHLQRIDREEAGAEVREKMDLLLERIRWEGMAQLFDQAYETMVGLPEKERKEIEEKRLPTDPTLARCLKNMPAHWLTGICHSLGLDPAPRREKRTEQILENMGDKSKLLLLLQQAQGHRGPELLRYLLQRGGWARMNGVTRKFGSMEGDGFFWEEDVPASPTGRLWALGLAAVGKANLGQRREKIVTIPRELREALVELLEVGDGQAESGTLTASAGSGAARQQPESGGQALVFRATLTDHQARGPGQPLSAGGGTRRLHPVPAGIVHSGIIWFSI